MSITNLMKGNVRILHQYPGQEPTLFIPTLTPSDSGEWRGSLFSSSATCEQGAVLIAEMDKGQRYTFGPPLCRGQRWQITDPPAAGATP